MITKKPLQLLGIVILLSTSFIILPTESKAAYWGVRAGSYTDMDDFFIGGEFLSKMNRDFYFNPNIEYVFVEKATYITFNFDLRYNLITNRSSYLWCGGGIGALYFDPEIEGFDSETDMGVNLLLGFGARTRNKIKPYIQGKFILGDNDEFVLGVGVRF